MSVIGIPSIVEPLCLSCVHRDGHPFGRCDAFPDGIPEEIIKARKDHTKPYPGDKGIQYKSFRQAEIDAGIRQP